MIIRKFPYLSFSTMLLLLLLAIEKAKSIGKVFAQDDSDVYMTLIFVNVALYIGFKFLIKHKKPMDSKIRRAIESTNLHRELDEKIFYPKFKTAAKGNLIEVVIDGYSEKVEKDYEKAIPVFENVLDLDVVEWSYQRGTVRIVFAKGLLTADSFYESTNPTEYLTLGIDSIGEVKWFYNKFPHMLLVGGTGSGKSTMFKSVIVQMQMDWELFFCDPKQVEFAELSYLGYKVAFDEDEIKQSIDRVVELMEERYSIMRENRVKEYRELDGLIKPCFLIIDEFAAFFSLLEKKDAELYTKKLRTLVQKGRASGVQLILMTQKPSSKVLDTDTRDNLMCQVAMGSNKTEAYVMAFGDDGRECKPLGIGEGYYNIGDGIRKMKTYNLSTDEFISGLNRGGL